MAGRQPARSGATGLPGNCHQAPGCAERDLAAHYGVAYGTVRRGMQVLRERGLIETIHGRGAFVADK